MISLKVVLFTSKKLKSGEHPIMIRMTKERKSKYISLGCSCSEDLWDKQKSLPKRKHPNYRELSILIEDKKTKVNKKVYSIELEDEEATLDEIYAIVTNKKKSTTILAYTKSLEERFIATGQIGNSKVYRDLHRVLSKYLNEKDINIKSINTSFLSKIEQYFRVLGWKPNTMGIYFRTLRSTLNKAITDGYLAKGKNPFADYSIARLKNETVKRAITQEETKRIEALQLEDPKERLAQDFFMFSYYCSGMNFMDFAHLKLSDFREEEEEGRYSVVYLRKKTKKLMKLALVPQAVEIYERYAEDKLEEEYVFPILDSAIHRKSQSIAWRIQKLNTQVNKALKEIGKKANIKTPITTYTARHTFATTLKRLGQPTAVISNMMGHQTEAITQVYLDSFENEVLYEASLKL